MNQPKLTADRLVRKAIVYIRQSTPNQVLHRQETLRANIAETTHLALITEQGENRNQREKQWNLSGFPHGFACRGT